MANLTVVTLPVAIAYIVVVSVLIEKVLSGHVNPDHVAFRAVCTTTP